MKTNPPSVKPGYGLVNAIHNYVNHCRTRNYGLDSLSYHGAKLWTLLPNDMTECKDLDGHF